MSHNKNKMIKHLWGSVFLALFMTLASTCFPSKALAVTSGPGAWDVLVFGNYDLVSPNTGEAYKNLSTPTWNNELNNGYGGGIGLVYWFNDTVAFRIEAQTNLYTIPNANALQSSPLTGGFEIKLLGDPDYFLYFVIDAGAAYEEGLNGKTFFGTASSNAWSAYGDAGLGFNLNWIFIEAKIAYLPQTLAHSSSSQNGLWYIPLTAGFNF